MTTRTAQLQRSLGLLVALAACWPVWRGVAALAERDYLGCTLTLVMAWLLARSGVELIESADAASPTATQRPPSVSMAGGAAASSDERGAR